MNQDSTDPFKKRVDDFSKEVGELGKKVEKHLDQFGKTMDNKTKNIDNWFYRTFGVLGPLISSLGGLIVLGIVIWLFFLIGNNVNSSFFNEIADFLLTYIVLFFAISLIISYTEYGNKRYTDVFRWISPLSTALGITVAIWVILNIITILGINIPFFTSTSAFIIANIIGFFILILIFGYLIMFLVRTLQNSFVVEPSKSSRFKNEKTETVHTGSDSIKRLFRSGKDKILGGVCGGISDFFNIDPTIIRIIWIIGTVITSGGLGILYIIFWIIIPRNPAHKWN